jgi:hypothetical protein
MSKDGLIRLIAAGLILIGFSACALGSKEVFHSFEFDNLEGNKDIEILDYQYGDSNMAFTRPDKDYLATGHIQQAARISGMFPVGQFLYVKWRVNSTGKVYNDTVDLKSRLPLSMDHKIVHFEIKGPQLYVYLIKSRHAFHVSSAADCQAKFYAELECTRLYPDHWSNF